MERYTSLGLLLLAACGSLTYYGPPALDGAINDTSDTGSTPGDDDDDTLPGDDDDDTVGGNEDCSTPGDEDGDTAADCEDPDCASVCDVDQDGYVSEALGGDDCDDADNRINPGEFDLCDELDNDCNDAVDDADGDGDRSLTCDDCDDSDALRYPGANDVCGDSVDSDCDGRDCVGGDFADDFETGVLGSDWVRGGRVGWDVTDIVKHNGTFGAKSANIGDTATSSLSLTLTYSAAGDISFWHKGSTEPNFDDLIFEIDGAQQLVRSGEWNWTSQTYQVGAGSHTFTWSYVKDGSISSGTDRVAIDDVTATNGAP